MQLMADRFAIDDRGRALDLATGARVTLTFGTAGGISEQLRWRARCDALHALHHRAIARLVDFGLIGETERFEAWACGPPWRAGAGEARVVFERAERFLRAMSLSSSPFAHDRICVNASGQGQFVPDAGGGYPLREDQTHAHRSVPIADCTLRRIERPEVASLVEMFQPPPGSRPRIAALWGADGSGRRVAVGELARAARAAGFVPVAAALLDSPLAALCLERSLFVIAEEDQSDLWRSVLAAVIRTVRPHVLMIVGRQDVRHVDSVALKALDLEALEAAVVPAVSDSHDRRRLRAAATRARGLPGRFARLLWPDVIRGVDRAASNRRVQRAAERPAMYGQEPEPPLVPAAASPACAWPAPGELAALRRRVETATTAIAAGRHAPGTRDLRNAIGGLARRGAWLDAGQGALALAAALVHRGRVRDAQAAMDQGREYATRAGSDALLIDLAILGGDAWIDLTRLDEADAVAATAATAARAAGDRLRAGAASLVIARAAFWRGRYADAAAALEAVADGQPPSLCVRHATLAARSAVGAGDVARALAHVADATRIAQDAGGAALAAAAHYGSAFVRVAVGDWDAAERDIAATIANARAAHDPLRAIRARLLECEVARRRRGPAVRASLERLRRAMAAAPPLVRRRWELAMAVSAAPAEAAERVAKETTATGLGAMPVYVAPATDGASAGRGSGDRFVDQLIAILHVCQTAEEDGALLTEVCARVRQHLHASAVAIVAPRDERTRLLASDGARLDAEIARRAATAGVVVGPHRHDDRIEAAAPVVYGGAAIGALCARWTLGSMYDTSMASSILATTAAAAAPIVAAAIAKADHEAAAVETELVGATPTMVELRRSVERAAAAPFAVLIDGESGSGKELVARAIHRGSLRRHKAFCTLNCAALPDDLIESELFGHARGSFTGAVADRAGVFEEAHGGTLFLDEVGELSPRAQAKVLRVIQEGELRRVGEATSRRIDVRIVAATNRDLRREVEAGRFRLDLLYRLDVVHVTVPPLRERREDVVVLAERFWRDAAARVGSRATLAAATTAALARYDWPGNVRELQNVLASLAVRSPRRGVVPPSALPEAFTGAASTDAWRLDEARRTFEERFIRAALVRTGGHRGRAAAELGVSRQGLTKLMSRLGIGP